MNKKAPSTSFSPEIVFDLLMKGKVDKSLAELVARYIKEGQENDSIKEYQGALSYWAENIQDTKQKVIVTLDGRDTAGKGSNIKRVTGQLDSRRYSVKAFPGIPTSEEKFEDKWFQRYEKFFPQEGNIRFFDRSWYNRAGVEAAMGFCTEEEYSWFMSHVNDFEKERIIDEGYDFLKIYLSISKKTQKERLQRRKNVRKRWKSSPIDAQAQEKWNYYTLAKQRILEETDSPHAPWMILDSNEKFESAREIIKALVGTNVDIRKIIESDLSIDLSPDSRIRRTATQELEKMKQEGQIPVDKKFKFRQV